MCKFFPTPAEIRGLIDKVNANGIQLQAEEAWQLAIDWVMRHYHPDIGVSRRAPQLDATIERAVRAAGGMNFLYNCSREDLQWAKKRFLEYFVRIHETGQAQHLLTSSEAKNLLAKIARKMRQSPALPASAKSAVSQPAQQPDPRANDSDTEAATAKARLIIFGPPLKDKSDAELAEVVLLQKQALRDRGWLPYGEPATEGERRVGQVEIEAP
jgi:hypothetical protein